MAGNLFARSLRVTDRLDRIRMLARGKINLSLRVLGRRPDGYHALDSWMQPIDWCDELTIRMSDSPGILLKCDDRGAPTGPENLICRAARALSKGAGRELQVEIELVKRLPMGGGLGGGSADAAATLLGLAALWGIARGDSVLANAAEFVGSDVPFFLGGGAAIIRGRGERVEPHPRPFDGWAALIVPQFGVDTGSVYAAWRASLNRGQGPPYLEPWANVWRDAEDLSLRLTNDLTPAAFEVEPRLGQIHSGVHMLNGARVHMSGSGSTLFALFDDEPTALAWLASVRNVVHAGAGLRVVRVLTTPPISVS